MSWKFWNLFKSDTTVEDAIEHSVGYDLSPDTLKPVEEVIPAGYIRAPQPISAKTLNLDYTFVFPANTQDGMPQSRFPEPWEKQNTDTKKKA